MPKSTAACNAILALIFNGTAWADIAQNDGSGPLTDLYVSFHTASPGVGGAQTQNEVAYTDYARVAVVRTTSGWAVPSGGQTSNVGQVQFPQCGASGATATHVAIGTDPSGTGRVLYQGALNAPLAISNLIQPLFPANALTVTET